VPTNDGRSSGFVLFVFYRLVTSHHTKLYAPTDYRDETLFFRTLPPERQKARMESEIQESEAAVAEAASEAPFARGRPDAQRQASDDGPARYFLAEELALRQLEVELGSSINRKVEIISLPGLAFDGVALTKDGPAVIEIKYTRQPLFSSHILSRVLDRFVSARAALKGQPSARLYFVVVADMSPQNQALLQENLRKYIGDRVPGVELRVLNFARLKEQFGAGQSS
jgi:hypothetical protein